MASKLFEWQNDSGEYLDHYEISKDNGVTWENIGINTTYLWENIDIEGIYVFKVKALNARGDSSNETSWTFEYIKNPEINKINTIDDYTTNTSETFEWSLTSGKLDHYEIQLDGGGWITNNQNATYTWNSLSIQSHTIEVKAIDVLGIESTIISWSFEVIENINVNKITSIDNYTYDTSKTFEWSLSSGSLDHYEIQLDGGGWTSNNQNTTYTWDSLSIQSHTIEVKAIDIAGNENIISWSFEVIGALSLNNITGSIINIEAETQLFEWSLNTGSLDHYEVSIDGGINWINVNIDTSYTWDNIPEGTQTFKVKGIDILGNEDIITWSFEKIQLKELYMWGRNRYGQIGNGDVSNTPIYDPILINHPNLNDNFNYISLHLARSLAIDNNGKLWSWGYDGYENLGTLGLGDLSETTVPTPTEIVHPNGDTWIYISTGLNHSGAIDSSNKLWMWGDNSHGILGDGTNDNKNIPTEIAHPNGDTWVYLSLGQLCSSAIDNNGKLWTWGSNVDAQLGVGQFYTELTSSLVPLEVIHPEGDTWNKSYLPTEGTYSSAIDSSGRLYVWGNNNAERLALGDTVDKPSPTLQPHPEGDTWVKVSMDQYSWSVLDSSGRIYVWGSNNYGQLGFGDTTARMYLSVLNHPEGDIWTDINRCYGSFTMIDSSSRMYVCGYGMYGMLGMNTYVEFGTNYLYTPTLNPYFTTNNLNLLNSTMYTRGVLVNV